MTAPRTIHDFGGFPSQLYEVQNPARGEPGLADGVCQQSAATSHRVERPRLAAAVFIGGAVTLANGRRIAPGNSPGTLTMGSLTMNAGSVLDFELGQANTAGGTLNDLINVDGNLTLDGAFNVTPSVGGTYAAGIYRLINYTGALTDNGLSFGLMPAGSTNFIDTSTAHQINLNNSPVRGPSAFHSEILDCSA